MPHFNLSNPVLKQHYLKFLFILLPVLFYTNSARAQTLVTSGNISSPPAAGEYYHPTAITLSPGFSFTATAGQSFRAYISGTVCIPLAATPSGNQNYVTTYVPRAAGIANPADPNNSNCQVMQTIQYLDGLGRPLQTVQVKGSPTGLKDVVQPAAYDGFGRETVRYLPYTTDQGTPGSYRPDALNGTTGYGNSAQKQFYNQPGLGYATIPSPYAVTNYEASSLNRPVEQGAPGDPWQPSASGISGSGHVVKTDYGTNAANEVRLWQVNAGGNGASWNNSFYDANQLYKTTITDENGNHTVAFKDKQNQVVLKQAESNNGYLSTYYVYNDLGNLAYVVPPMPQNVYPQSFSEQDQVFGQYIYGCHYDYRNRMMEKKLPGKGWEFMVYNTLDQVVMTQDANQRNKTPQQWTFTKYDGQGRAIMTGIWTYGNSQATTTADNSGRLWLENYYATTTEPKWETRDNTTSTGYNNLSTPAGTNYTFLTINYYDDYSFPGADAFGSPAPNTVAGQSASVRGLLTGSKVNILGTATMLLSVNYYDDKGRVLQSKSQNHLGGQDVANNTYGFTGELLAGNRSHTGTNGNSVTIANRYDYDHMGRKKNSYEQINGNAQVQLSALEYNETGQLKTKSLGGGLQRVDYNYNERGWLTGSTAPLFAMQLNYNSGSAPQWNGNISSQYWGTAGNLSKHYDYGYDKLNQLTRGISSEGYNETGPGGNDIDYDGLGNILHLSRTGGANSGNYTYNYNGNQLVSVSGLTNNNYHYDLNGNMDYDARSGNNISYNLLNLPQGISGGQNLSYTYDATGQKLKRQSANSSFGTEDYVGGIQYKNGTIEFVQTEEGRARRNSDGSYSYEYTLTDHLGNNRLSFDNSGGTARAIQQDDYFPFGLNYNRLTNGYKNNYLYNRKELQEELGQYDYGARFYDPIVVRWGTVDPLAEISRRWSPYNYVENNPIRNIDPDGMETYYGQEAQDVFRQLQAQTQQDPPNKKKGKSTEDWMEEIDAKKLKDAPHLKSLTNWWQKALYFVNGREFNGVSYDDQGNPTGIPFHYIGGTIDLVGPAGELNELKHLVYLAKGAEDVEYVGITNNLARRAAEQLAEKGIKIELLMENLTRADARAVEQALIEIHKLPKNGGTLINKINSISKSNSKYAQSVERGYELLKSIGYPK